MSRPVNGERGTGMGLITLATDFSDRLIGESDQSKNPESEFSQCQVQLTKY